MLKSINKLGWHLSLIGEDLLDFLKSKSDLDNRHILISGAPRSGTTWVGELLNSYRNRLLHEPFARCNLLWNWSLEDRIEDIADFKAIDTIHRQIIDGVYWERYRKFRFGLHPYLGRFAPHRYMGRNISRAIIKDPTVCYMLEDIRRRYGYEIVLLYRNPLSIVSSLKRLGWDPTRRLEIIYSNRYFERFCLNELPLGYEDIGSMSDIEKMALQTALLHFFIRYYEERHSPVVLYYESLADDVMSLRTDVYQRFELDFEEVNMEQFERLTKSSCDSYHVHQFDRDPSIFRDIWKDRLNHSEIQVVTDIYESINGPYMLADNSSRNTPP